MKGKTTKKELELIPITVNLLKILVVHLHSLEKN